MLFLKLFLESCIFAFNAIIVNKLRTILSLLGITIGIFTIISVFTVFDSLENKISESIASLGENTLFVQKWPWGGGGGPYAWWKYINRPEVKLNELRDIQKRNSNAVEACAFMISTSKNVEYQSNSIENAVILCVSEDYDKIWSQEISEGRFLSSSEFIRGTNAAVIGSNIAENLFNNQHPLDKTVRIFKRKLKVIGVFKKKGEDLFQNNPDNQVVIPVNYAKNVIDVNSEMLNPLIMVKAKATVSMDELKDEMKGIMRSIRKLKPSVDDNFALNETSIASEEIGKIFRTIGIAGWIIGGFSILVGGFGVANIMFVSVKERTSIIGIQKALGAKSYFILLQFLFESVILSLVGGALGLLLVFAGSMIASKTVNFEFTLTVGNIMLGLGISAMIGLISGLIPAFFAARLDPVKAIRS